MATAVPAKKAHSAQAAAPRRPARRPRAAPNCWAINVLVIDDDEADTILALSILRQHPSVSSATSIASPEQALMQLATGKLRPNLILLDIQMPRVSGFKFLEALDQIPVVRDTPIIMLTTSCYARDVENARRMLASGYIIKPESPDDLRHRLDIAVKQTLSGAWS